MAEAPTNRSQREDEVRAWYEPARWRFNAFERAVVPHLRRSLASGGLRNLQIESRTKSVDSYVAKALSPDPVAPEEFRYTNPATEITDAVGARVIVPLSTDVEPVRRLLHEHYVVEEEVERGAEDQLEVPGYQSLHLLVRLRESEKANPDFAEISDMVLEVQVRTILQHAWASLQHDLAYKTARAPAPSLKRRLTALAGVLELADREFVAVRAAHGAGTPSVKGGSPTAYGETLSAASLRKLVTDVVGEAEDVDEVWFQGLTSVLTDLGFHEARTVYRSLNGWEGRAAEVATAVRATRPYANSAFIFDQLVRLALGEAYFDRRVSHAELANPTDAKRAFMAETAQLLQTVGGSA
jgi:ppGpp synthetase/RelA/SpoT-type nucleotidyltranferase